MPFVITFSRVLFSSKVTKPEQFCAFMQILDGAIFLLIFGASVTADGYVYVLKIVEIVENANI